MPLDTSTPTPANTNNPQPHVNASRPQMPSLSAAAVRVMNRNPLTPKIASPKIASKSQQPPTLATAVTPTSRRPQGLTLANSNRDESSSFQPHLNSNITPRSGSRQSRVNSANTTPNTTPNPERLEFWESRSSFGLPSPRFEGEVSRRSVVSFGSIHPDTNAHGRQDVPHASESKFFHASDVKPARPVSASKAVQPKGPTFFYANGNMVENKPSHPAPSVPVSGHMQDNLSSKFMYANGTPELRNSPPPPISRSSGSTVSVAHKAPTSRAGTNPLTGNHTATQRPNSPTKVISQALQPAPKTNNGPGSGRPQVVSPQLGPSPPGLRRSSSGAPQPKRHSRSGSLAKLEQFSTSTSSIASQISPDASPSVSISARTPPLTLASIIQAAEDFTENEVYTTPDEVRSGMQSPTRSVHSADPVGELVANARRERKVQDLQITNASLEAINRTLERQLRRQTAELRRYKRLSRVGLSLASTSLSTKISSEVLSEQQEAGPATSLSEPSEEEDPITEEEEEEEEEEEGEESEEESEESLDSDSVSESLSPSVIAERDVKHRKRDEQRLRLDLSKHQQLLVDSQKINHSIIRCIDWTDALISEGRKALEYRVRASDVELGGRVLDPLDDEDERPLTADSTPDDTITLSEKILDNPISLASWGAEPQDRDSGIELAVDGG
ncbi:hypothetical protein AAE478_009611 [Parahypoxylon ruwenzoriense]